MAESLQSSIWISHNHIYTIGLLVLFILLDTIQADYDKSFRWSTSPWSDCVHQDSGECCHCYHVRNISCIHSDTEKIVPPFYCHKSNNPRPLDQEPCAPCLQSCVLSMWGEWSTCTDVCTPGSRYRTRSVIVPPGASSWSCDHLVELEECQNPDLPLCIFTDLRPQYDWRVGDWGSCRMVESSEKLCGEGIRGREVSCENSQNQIVANEYCHFYLPGSKPANEESCDIACDCEVSDWTEWGPCSKTCSKGSSFHGYQVRTRDVTRPADQAGVPCPTLKDTQPCDQELLPRCPRFIWQTTDWSECILLKSGAALTRSRGQSITPSGCGPGLQTRDVYCSLEGDSSEQPVADILCVKDSMSWNNESSPLKPTERRACQVSCPRDCLAGEWENWSSCTQSCGQGGVRIRVRSIIQENTGDGEKCNDMERFEEKPCDPMPCSWWHTGQWSACFAESSSSKCGSGSQVRSVYCLNSLDEVISDDNCTVYGDKPDGQQHCWVACPGECQVSEWTLWGDCSRTCGVQGGTQTRSRFITDRGSDLTAPCMPEEELSQMRVCNQVACRTYLWQVSPWGDCVRLDNISFTQCGEENTGIQYRDITCQIEPGLPVEGEKCHADDKPLATQLCAAPCPQNCKLSGWGDWSFCSQTCGPNSLKVKFRSVLRWPLYGGKPCPGDPDEDGIIHKMKPCNKRSLVCDDVQWETSEWGQCEVRGHKSCGKGIQTRNVTCIEDSGREVHDGVCYDAGHGSSPDYTRFCHIPCSGDCHLGPWSAFSPCSQTCGETPAYQTRTRYLINSAPFLDIEVQCPGLKASELTESLECGVLPCPSYHWHVSDWTSCIPRDTLDSSKVSCGDGTQQRHVFCMTSDGLYVPQHKCHLTGPVPQRTQRCHVTCTRDCTVSDWSIWSNCSQICGDGLQHRERKVVQEAVGGGRKCPALQEVATCYVQDCEELDWRVLSWGECEPYWGMHCGPGVQKRRVKCPAGKHFNGQCAARNPKPDTQTDCVKPCAGDCVMSEWSEFPPCDCRERNATRTRYRTIIREPVVSALQCESLAETESCDCSSYQLIIGGWTNCHLFKSADDEEECGKGIQKRPVNCVRDDGVIVHLSHCHLGNLTLSQSCHVPCPVDCVYSEYSEWSQCNTPCGSQAIRTRSIEIIREGNRGGRACPGPERLIQTGVCNSVPCYNYSWHRDDWSDCVTMTTGSCGVSVQTRVIHCVRSDGHTVKDSMCFQQEGLQINSLEDMGQQKRFELDLDKERSCGEPCPGDCVISEWSDFGPCIRNCSDSLMTWFQSRSRVVIRPTLGGRPCPEDNIQTRLCPSETGLCPLFEWDTGKWNNRNKRRVHCRLKDGPQVHGGCLFSEEPSRRRDCAAPCGGFSECVQGKCKCEPGYSESGGVCLPEFGCASDSHCFLNTTYCDIMNKECLCWDDTLPGPDLICSPYGAPSRSQDPLEELNQLFIYILIGCLIALLFLGIVTVICMIRTRGGKRRRRKPKDSVSTNKLTKIDNLETAPKNNDPQSEIPLISKSLDKDRDHKNLHRSWERNQQRNPYLVNLALPNRDRQTGESTSSGNASSPSFSTRTESKVDNTEDVNIDLEELLLDITENSIPQQHSPGDVSSGENCDTPLFGSTRNKMGKPMPGSKQVLPVKGITMNNPYQQKESTVSDPYKLHQPSPGSSLNSPRASPFRTDSPGSDTDLKELLTPQNDLSPRNSVSRERRFPVSPVRNDIDQPRSPLDMRNLAGTPPHMYENLSSSENAPTPPPRPANMARLPPPTKPKPKILPPHLINERNQSGRPVTKRTNTEPLPDKFRVGPPQTNARSPTSDSLIPSNRGTDNSGSTSNLQDLRGRSRGAHTPVPTDTEELLKYCDEILADLQQLANS